MHISRMHVVSLNPFPLFYQLICLSCMPLMSVECTEGLTLYIFLSFEFLLADVDVFLASFAF